jgi:hypothetical protein
MQLEHVLGKYIISDTPMSEEQWARERATVIDAEPVSPVTPALPRDQTPAEKPSRTFICCGRNKKRG